MSTRVYKYRLRPPIEGAEIVRAQIREECVYRNHLCAIERGRRAAIRALEDTEATRATLDALKSATRSDRKAARRAHVEARRAAREQASTCEDTERLWAAQGALAGLAYGAVLGDLRAHKLVTSKAKRELRRARAEAGDRLAAIALLDEEILANLYEHSPLVWGSKLTVHAASNQFRRADLYDDDKITPRDPHYRRSNAIRYWPSHEWSFGDGQVSVHVQNRSLTTIDAQSGNDAWIRIQLETGQPMLWLRVGSDGRRPVWAQWEIFTSRDGKDREHYRPRALPEGKITWARVRCSHTRLRGEGRGNGEIWECTLTVAERAPTKPSVPAVRRIPFLAVEVCWDKPRDDLIVARWRDSFGSHGSIVLPKIPSSLEHASGIRSVRDQLLERAKLDVQRKIVDSRDAKPRWLVEAAGMLHFWKSAGRLHDLARRWRGEKCDAAREAYDCLQAWEMRDAHLWAYESSRRAKVLRSRKDFYRCLARRWERAHALVILDDRRLDHEARFGEASELRFQAGPAELRGAVAYAFGDGRVKRYPWREEVSEEDDRDWCERAIDAHLAGSAREGKNPKRTVHGAGGAWGARLSGQRRSTAENAPARKPAAKVAE